MTTETETIGQDSWLSPAVFVDDGNRKKEYKLLINEA